VTLRSITLAVLLISGNGTTTCAPLGLTPSMPTELLPPPPHDVTKTSTLKIAHPVFNKPAFLIIIFPY
jgi:hypothetical protein